MRSRLIAMTVVPVLLLASALFVSAQDESARVNTGTQLTKEEAVELTKSPDAQDHRKLADYFRNEAREAENMAEMHEAMSSAIGNPATGRETQLQMKQTHDFIDSARNAEKSALEMAKEQDAIAKRLEENASATK